MERWLPVMVRSCERFLPDGTKKNSEGHIKANEYSVEKGEEIKQSLIQALEAY
jgi:hypothetical protein